MNFSQSSKAAIAARLPRIIYVEGKDDAYFIDRLLNEIGASPSDIGIVFIEGDGALEKELGLLVKSASYVQRTTNALAFMLDADASVENRLKSVSSTFQSRGLPRVGHDEVVHYDGERNLGLYLFPSAGVPGELEDLLLSTVEEDDRLHTVRQALEEVEGNHGALNKRSKRIARMYISVLPIKPCGVGRGYCEGVFKHDHADVEKVREFLRKFLQT